MISGRTLPLGSVEDKWGEGCSNSNTIWYTRPSGDKTQICSSLCHHPPLEFHAVIVKKKNRCASLNIANHFHPVPWQMLFPLWMFFLLDKVIKTELYISFFFPFFPSCFFFLKRKQTILFHYTYQSKSPLPSLLPFLSLTFPPPRIIHLFISSIKSGKKIFSISIFGFFLRWGLMYSEMA